MRTSYCEDLSRSRWQASAWPRALTPVPRRSRWLRLSTISLPACVSRYLAPPRTTGWVARDQRTNTGSYREEEYVNYCLAICACFWRLMTQSLTSHPGPGSSEAHPAGRMIGIGLRAREP